MPFVNSVFLSATFEDLKEERSAAIETFTCLGILTCSMEMFGANYHDKQEFIKKLIGEMDFFAVIVGGTYGDYLYPRERLSFTEWEYNIAMEYGKKVFAFVPDNLKAIPVDKTDRNKEKERRLNEFIKKLKDRSLIYPYQYGNVDSLTAAIFKSFSAYGYRDKPLSKYCGIWVSKIDAVRYEEHFFEYKSDEWTFYGRGNHVYGDIRRLVPENDKRTWSFVGIEFGDQLLISFAQNDAITKSAGIVIWRKDVDVDGQIKGYYYEFSKIASDSRLIPIPIVLKRKSTDWNN